MHLRVNNRLLCPVVRLLLKTAVVLFSVFVFMAGLLNISFRTHYMPDSGKVVIRNPSGEVKILSENADRSGINLYTFFT
jgi:hypothetical protein